jgi:hypothetical protein
MSCIQSRRTSELRSRTVIGACNLTPPRQPSIQTLATLFQCLPTYSSRLFRQLTPLQPSTQTLATSSNPFSLQFRPLRRSSNVFQLQPSLPTLDTLQPSTQTLAMSSNPFSLQLRPLATSSNVFQLLPAVPSDTWHPSSLQLRPLQPQKEL